MTLRYITAAAVLASMAIHLTLWFQGMRDVHVIGPAFLVNVVAAGWPSPSCSSGGATGHPPCSRPASACATLGAFTLAATVGLLRHPRALGGLLRLGGRDRRGRRDRWPASRSSSRTRARCAAAHRGGRRRAETPQRTGRASPAPRRSARRARSAAGRRRRSARSRPAGPGGRDATGSAPSPDEATRPGLPDEERRHHQLELVDQVVGQELGVHRAAALDHQPAYAAGVQVLGQVAHPHRLAAVDHLGQVAEPVLRAGRPRGCCRRPACRCRRRRRSATTGRGGRAR